MKKILTLTEYKEMFIIPDSENVDSQNTQIEMRIADATNQIDNFCGGLVFKNYDKLDPTKDVIKIYKLKRAIASLTNHLEITGGLFYNGKEVGGGTAPFNLQTKSSNSEIEIIRQDIIKNLKEAGFYLGVSTESNNIDITADSTTSSEMREELVNMLSQYFLRTDGVNQFQGREFLFPNTCSISNTGDITGSDIVDKNTGMVRKPIISGYDLKVDSENSINTENIKDPLTGQFKKINEFTADYFGGLSKEEIYQAITASGTSWSAENTYRKDYICLYIDSSNQLKFYKSKLDNNFNNDPSTAVDWWVEIKGPNIDVNAILSQIRPELPNVVKSEVDKVIATYQKSLSMEGVGVIKEFKDVGDYERFKANFGIDDTYFMEYDDGVETKIAQNTGHIKTLGENLQKQDNAIKTIQTTLPNKIDKFDINKTSPVNAGFTVRGEPVEAIYIEDWNGINDFLNSYISWPQIISASGWIELNNGEYRPFPWSYSSTEYAYFSMDRTGRVGFKSAGVRVDSMWIYLLVSKLPPIPIRKSKKEG